MRGQSTFTADSNAWPTAPPYPVPEKVMQFRFASPISLAAAASSGAGSTNPGGNCCADTDAHAHTVKSTLHRLAVIFPPPRADCRSSAMVVNRKRHSKMRSSGGLGTGLPVVLHRLRVPPRRRRHHQRASEAADIGFVRTTQFPHMPV